MTEKMFACESCDVVEIESRAVARHNGEWLCQDCFEDVLYREQQEADYWKALELDLKRMEKGTAS